MHQRQESEGDLGQKLIKLQLEKQNLQDTLDHLHRNLANLEIQKNDVEKSSMRLVKDKDALLKTLDKASF